MCFRADYDVCFQDNIKVQEFADVFLRRVSQISTQGPVYNQFSIKSFLLFISSLMIIRLSLFNLDANLLVLQIVMIKIYQRMKPVLQATMIFIDHQNLF